MSGLTIGRRIPAIVSPEYGLKVIIIVKKTIVILRLNGGEAAILVFFFRRTIFGYDPRLFQELVTLRMPYGKYKGTLLCDIRGHTPCGTIARRFLRES
jgi:hypothetical protein